MEDLEIIKEFVIESTENLGRLDREMVELEQNPDDSELLASIFRTIHTVKGTCGFLDFKVLERITHQAESILCQVREGSRSLTEHLVSLILETVDAIKIELTAIEATCLESGAGYDDLFNRLREAAANFTPLEPVEKVPDPIKTEPKKLEPLKPPVITEAPPEEAEPLETTAVNGPATLSFEKDQAASASKNISLADSTIRVDVGQLDRLMNLVGELVLARNQILQFSARHEDVGLNATTQRLNLITSELQEGVMKTRMQPIGNIWGKLPRVVRDLANTCGKQIGLEMEGADTELDKTIIEAIQDPLTHIVRNSCDHGIERPEARAKLGKPVQGKLLLRAFHEGGNVIIEISDDGGGIDPQRVKKSAIEKGLLRPEQAERMRDSELVNLVFLPGFSTAATVSNISGRGVGMDVVKTNIEKIGGAVDLVSRPGQGTTVKVRIPLTLAIIPGLVVTSGGQRFVIPQASLLELVRLEGPEGARQIDWIRGEPVCRRRGQLLPLVFLNLALKIGEKRDYRRSEVFNIIVLQAEDRQFGLVVDDINDTQEIVVKPLGKQLKTVPCYSGATIMGDGKVALILDVVGLAKATSISSEGQPLNTAESTRVREHSIQKQALLLFRGGGFDRLVVPLSLVARLEEVPRSKIEHAAGRAVIQYRERILPLVPLSEHLGGPAQDDASTNDPAQVIVFSDADRRIGLVVDQILDIVEDTVSMKRQSARPGLLGSAVVGEKVTDFLDLQSIIQQAEEGWFDKARPRRKQATVLIAEASAFSRNLLRNTLDIAGYNVLEASSASEALEKLGKNEIDIMVASLDLPDHGATSLLHSIKENPDLGALPVVALTSNSESIDAASGTAAGFDDYLAKFDRSSMLRSLGKLAVALQEAELPVEALAK